MVAGNWVVCVHIVKIINNFIAARGIIVSADLFLLPVEAIKIIDHNYFAFIKDFVLVAPIIRSLLYWVDCPNLLKFLFCPLSYFRSK